MARATLARLLGRAATRSSAVERDRAAAVRDRSTAVRLVPRSTPHGQETGRLVSTWMLVDGLRIHACMSVEPLPPTAPTIVLVHGVAVSHRYLLPLARHLALRARVYVPDLPGYGLSDKLALRDLAVPELAHWLLAWMDATGLERPHLLGNSFGCQVAAHLAMLHPERVGRLVLQGPSMDPHARTAVRQVARWLGTAPFENYSEAFVLLRDFLDLGPRRLVGMLRIGLRDQIDLKLRHITAPTLVVRGSRDLIVPQTWADEATRLLLDGRLIVIEGAAHTINYSQPAWLREAIWPFLTEATADGRGTPLAPNELVAGSTVGGRISMSEWTDPMQADGMQADGDVEPASEPDGSEPGGAAGAENIERHAGVASGQPTSTEKAVQDMAESVEGDQGAAARG